MVSHFNRVSIGVDVPRCQTRSSCRESSPSVESAMRRCRSGVPAFEKGQPTVAILLGTYNGQSYLWEQLESIACQTHSNWVVRASDDGSDDDTPSILRACRDAWGADRLSILVGPKKGFSANFLSLVCAEGIEADYFAFADQDDIWRADKLERALEWLRSVPGNIPALYCSRTLLVDSNNNECGLSSLPSRPPDFRNALVQNIVGGNTAVFNSAARQLMVEAGAGVSVAAHDWWAYMLVTGCGGRVLYDAQPSLRYRQHAGNLVGVRGGWLQAFLRLRKCMGGRFRAWNDVNMESLALLRDKLTDENRAVFDRFSQARKKWLLPRVVGVMGAGVVRQRAIGSLGILFASIFGRI